MKRLIAISILFSAVMLSCGKKAHEVDPAYLGTWENVDGEGYITLNITKNTSRYEKVSGSTESYSEGKARIKGDQRKLKIGLKGFSIDQPPTPINASNGLNYIMELDGTTLVRY